MSAKKGVKSGDCRETSSESLVAQELGNAQTTCIIEELNSIYEARLRDIDKNAKGDFKLKCVTYKEWVDMLMRTMRHMLETLQVLESEATKRINLLERKLRIECNIDHSTDSAKLKSDLANLLELIRRAVEDKKWNTDGLEFKTITMKDIFRDPLDKCNNTETEDVQKLNSKIICQNQMIKRLETERNILRTELDAKELQLQKLNPPSCSKRNTPKTEFCSMPAEEDTVFKACISELRKDMREKECQLAETLKENECLKSELTLVKKQVTQKDKVITNIRALTIEVADKHDQIQQMRTQMFSLEEDLKKAEKKIQFKDNVIKELRRDCKNASKNCTCSKRSTSPRTRSPSPDKSGTFKVLSPRTERTMSQSGCSDYTLDTVVALESQKLQCCQIEENQRMKMLQKELNELFSIQSTHEGNMEDNRRMITCQQKRVQELVQQLLCDLYNSRNKLAFIRNRLLSINSPAPGDACGIDSGYNSQEDVEPEGTIINTIKTRMRCLSDENNQLKCQLLQVEQDVESFKSTASSCGHILKEVASTISAMLRKDINCDYSGDEQLKVNPLQEALATLNCELSEKATQIDELTKIKEELERELQCFKNTNCALHHESNAKDQTIFDLQETIEFQNSSLKLLQDIKEQLECDLCTGRESDVHKKLTKLLNDKAKLETEAMRMERLVMRLRDENVAIKELLVDYETDYCHLEQKYLGVTEVDRIQLQQYQNQEQKYLDIINDLTNELASLSVSMAQEEFTSDDMSAPFEASFRELESQNDLLQKTIESLELKIATHEARLSAYEKEIDQQKQENFCIQGKLKEKEATLEGLQSKYQATMQLICSVKARCRCGAAQGLKLDGKDLNLPPAKRPQDLQHIFEMLDRKNEELNAIKEYTSEEKGRLTKSILDLEDQVKQLQIKISVLEKSLCKREEELQIANEQLCSYTDPEEENLLKATIKKLNKELKDANVLRREREACLMAEIAAIRKSLDEQSKALTRANETVANLERQTHGYRKQGDAANKEVAILRAELFSLKEHFASQEGLVCSLRDQLAKTQDELCCARQDLERLPMLTEDLENFKRSCNRLKDSNYELVRKYNDLVEDYNKLEDEYRKLLDINDQMCKELEAGRNWQKEQSKQDKLIDAKICKLEDHITTLVEDRQALIDKINELYRDTLLIGGELEHYKDVFADSLSEARARTSLSLDVDSRTDCMDLVIRKIRRTSKKLSQTRSIWQDGIRRFSD